MGYSDANTVNFGANSNYNALQCQRNRRFGSSLTFGVAYTWSQAMGTTTDDGTYNHPSTRVPPTTARCSSTGRTTWSSTTTVHAAEVRQGRRRGSQRS